MREAGTEADWVARLFVAVTVVNAALLVYALVCRWRRGRWPFAGSWNLADVWFGAQLTLLCVALTFGSLIALVERFVPAVNVRAVNFADPNTLLWLILPGTLVQNACFFAVPAAYVGVKYGQRLCDIGLPPWPSRDDGRLGLLYGVGAMLISDAVDRGLTGWAEANRNIPWVAQLLRYDETGPMAAITKGLPALGVGGLLLAVLALGIAPAVGEEMFFRGFVFNAVKRRWGLAAGVLLSGLVFTVGHSYALGLVPIFCMGVLLALAYHRTGSLWVPILMHALNNTVLVLTAFFLPSWGSH